MTASKIAAQLIACLVLASVCFAQCIRTKRGAVVLFGSAANCCQPSTIHLKRVQKATSEWRTIKTEGVKKGSARYDLLTSDMNSRIKTVALLALEKKVPVVPCYLTGLNKLRPKGSREIKPGPAAANYQAPIYLPEGISVPDATRMIFDSLN